MVFRCPVPSSATTMDALIGWEVKRADRCRVGSAQSGFVVVGRSSGSGALSVGGSVVGSVGLIGKELVVDLSGAAWADAQIGA